MVPYSSRRLSEINGRRVSPGDEICVIEEFLPGPGTFEDDGIVRSALTGIVNADLMTRVVFVKPLVREPKIPERGDIVYGVVQVVRDEFAIIKIIGDYQGRRYSVPYTGLLHISQATEKYVKNLYDVLRMGDVVKAKVLSSCLPYNLTLKEYRLGVVMAFCGKCGERLVKSGSEVLKCPACGNVEHRKISSDYGVIRVTL